MNQFGDEIHELWDEPWEGMPEEEEPWTWDETGRVKNGPTKQPPNRNGKWWRWYFMYHEPSCTTFKVSADEDPITGKWFNPHRSSGSSL